MNRLLSAVVFSALFAIPALAQVDGPSAASDLTNGLAGASLPDSPGWTLAFDQQAQGTVTQAVTQAGNPTPCVPVPPPGTPAAAACSIDQQQNRPFIEYTKRIVPLTPFGKARLAFDDVKSPFNLLTIVGTSAYTIGRDAHTGYGPGMKGFGYNLGVSLSQDATGEFFGTFLVPVIFHQDPRYFRWPHATFHRRLLHVIEHEVIARGDNGHRMLNYSNLLTSPVTAQIANLYVPGIGTNVPDTTKRIVISFASEPIGNLVAEFLPDVASRIHIHVVFVQRILNNISGPGNPH